MYSMRDLQMAKNVYEVQLRARQGRGLSVSPFAVLLGVGTFWIKDLAARTLAGRRTSQRNEHGLGSFNVGWTRGLHAGRAPRIKSEGPLKFQRM